MAAARRRVFVEKVLKRLFPHDPRDREKRTPVPAASETLPTLPEKAPCGRPPPLPGGSTETPPRRRLYTATPPPEGCAPAPPEPLRDAGSESSSSGDDAADQDPRGQPKRRRIRRHRSKRGCEDPNSARVGHAASERRQSLLQENPHPRHTDGPAISKNKKRKLKKKQQMKRRRAAGSLTKASGISFLYQPGEDGPEQGDTSEGAGGGGPGAEDHEDAGDAEEDRGRGSDEKADGILDFFKSTQMYFYDGHDFFHPHMEGADFDFSALGSEPGQSDLSSPPSLGRPRASREQRVKQGGPLGADLQAEWTRQTEDMAKALPFPQRWNALPVLSAQPCTCRAFLPCHRLRCPHTGKVSSETA